MTWMEFIKGTGCKATEYNYEVFKHLEEIYMISDVSKAQIYECGKALVDDSKAIEVQERFNLS